MFGLLKKIIIGAALILPSVPAFSMDVYLFRGLAGVPFSVGLDDLEDKIKASGIHAETHPHSAWQQVYNKILRSGTKEVAFIGHSMGALSSISLAKKLSGSGIRVAYIGLIDIPGSGKVAPKNASWAEAYTSSQPGFYPLVQNPRFKNLVVNTRVARTVHITIDDSERVHDAIISAVWLAEASIGRTPKTVSAFAPARKAKPSGIDMILTGSIKKK